MEFKILFEYLKTLEYYYYLSLCGNWFFSAILCTMKCCNFSSSPVKFSVLLFTKWDIPYFSDPMLTSNDVDLMGSSSDVEAEKVTTVEDPDVEREVDSPAT